MRNVKHPHGPLEPQDVEELLPWYVTGRVTREEARGIEAALKTMPDLAEKLALTALLTSIFAQMLPGLAIGRPAAVLPVVLGAVGVVLLTTVLSHVLARRGVGWTNTLGQFLVMLGANFIVVFLYQALPGARDLPDAAVAFFVFLLSVIVTLFDRFQIIQRARWTTPRERATAA